MSETVGTRNCCPAFLTILRAASSPMPVKEELLVRFALRYDDLKIYGMPRFLQVPETFCATSITRSSLSTTQGPAIRKKFFSSEEWFVKKFLKNFSMSKIKILRKKPQGARRKVYVLILAPCAFFS